MRTTNLLLLSDTLLLLWAMHRPERLSSATQRRIEDRANDVAFSAVSILEVAIKFARGRGDFAVDPTELRRGLLRAGYRELPLTGEHAVASGALPMLHKDPFDRVLIAQARVEGAVLLTVDAAMAAYGAPVEWVG